jgi:hypothetical protein
LLLPGSSGWGGLCSLRSDTATLWVLLAVTVFLISQLAALYVELLNLLTTLNTMATNASISTTPTDVAKASTLLDDYNLDTDNGILLPGKMVDSQHTSHQINMYIAQFPFSFH